MNIPYQVMFLDLEVMRYQVMFLEMMRPMQWLLGIPIGSDRCCLRNTHYSLWMKLRSPKIVLGQFPFTIWLLTNDCDKKLFFSL